MIRRLFLAGLAVGIASPVLAGAWETFEMTCLVPMEASGDPATADLVSENSSEGADGQVSMAFYRDAEGRQLQVMRQGGVTFCGLRTFAEEQGAVALAYTRWLEVAFGSGRYTTIAPFTVRSTDWRDPPLTIEYKPNLGDGISTLTVGEFPENG